MHQQRLAALRNPVSGTGKQPGCSRDLIASRVHIAGHTYCTSSSPKGCSPVRSFRMKGASKASRNTVSLRSPSPPNKSHGSMRSMCYIYPMGGQGEDSSLSGGSDAFFRNAISQLLKMSVILPLSSRICPRRRR